MSLLGYYFERTRDGNFFLLRDGRYLGSIVQHAPYGDWRAGWPEKLSYADRIGSVADSAEELFHRYRVAGPEAEALLATLVLLVDAEEP